MRPLLIVRPEPGWSRTAARGHAEGWTVLGAPLFEVRPLAWSPPPADDWAALLFTSANAVRQAGAALERYAHLPCYAVGAATAAALEEASLSVIATGDGGVEAIARRMAADGVTRVLHLCGRDRQALMNGAPFQLLAAPVYAADLREPPPREILAALEHDPIVLLHSSRAAVALAALAGDRRRTLAVAALSHAVLTAAGPGWGHGVAAATPDDRGLLAAARALCDEAA